MLFIFLIGDKMSSTNFSDEKEVKEKIKSLVPLDKKLSPVLPKHVSGTVKCYIDGCNKQSYYTLGALLPSVWFTQEIKQKLVPVIVTSCLEHRNALIDNLPEKTVSVIIRDVSRDSFEIVSDMLKQALISKEDELIVFYSS